MATPYWKLPHRKPLQFRTAARQLVVVKCITCCRFATYLAADLAEILGPDRYAYEPPFPCSKCGKTEDVVVKLRMPDAGDYGISSSAGRARCDGCRHGKRVSWETKNGREQSTA